MKNSTCWKDDRGAEIQAHGGMIARFNDKWYWYGEHKGTPNVTHNNVLLSRVDVIGVSCYSSDDLLAWHYEGLALSAVPEDIHSPLHPSKVCERPKVIFNDGTGKYVMWFHADTADYALGHAGCAIANRPEGPFQLLHTQTPSRRDCRDMTLFQDPTDGKAYLIHSGDWNKTLYVSELDETYTGFTGKCYGLMQDQEREAPVFFWHEGLYYCLSSGCTGWEPNSLLYATSPQLTNGMKLIDNPCVGPNCRQTFGGQCTASVVAGTRRFLLLDHWKPNDLRHSGYSLLPMDFTGGVLTIRWTDEWMGLPQNV